MSDVAEHLILGYMVSIRGSVGIVVVLESGK